MKNTIKKILNVLSIILVVLIVIGAAFVFITKAKGEAVLINNKTFLWVLTPSMEPEIPKQSYMLVEKVDAKDIKVGDVITFISDDPSLNGETNTHRVVEIIGDNEEFVTKGDNNLVQDKYTAKAGNIQYRFVRVLPVLSVIGRVISSPAGLIITPIAIVLLFLALYLPELIKFFKNLKAYKLQEKQEKEDALNKLVQEEVERMKQENNQETDSNDNNDN